MNTFKRWWRCNRGAMAADIAKAACAIALLSAFSAHWLSGKLSPSPSDKQDLARMAATAARNGDDPEYTGSISHQARIVHLDPCTGRASR